MFSAVHARAGSSEKPCELNDVTASSFTTVYRRPRAARNFVGILLVMLCR
jgi:hypothetical protein